MNVSGKSERLLNWFTYIFSLYMLDKTNNINRAIRDVIECFLITMFN